MPSPAVFCPSSIIGTGSYAPERIMTNQELEQFVDTTDEWITTRTGIRERRIAAAGETTSDMAAHAARRAMEQAGVSAASIDLIIVATVTPDMFFPSTACFVQAKIGAAHAVAFDINAACSGFLYALQVARHFINTGNRTTALVIGAEKLSSLINWKDRNTCVLFGDGAGAVVIRRASEDDQSTQGQPGQVLSTVMGCDGRLSNILMVPGGASSIPVTPENVHDNVNTIVMEGREVFKHAVNNMRAACEDALLLAGMTAGDVDLVIAHQANHRIISAIVERLGLPEEKAFVNIDRYGNTSAASIPLALDEANRAGLLRRGQIILLVAFGAGLTWASSVIRW